MSNERVWSGDTYREFLLDMGYEIKPIAKYQLVDSSGFVVAENTDEQALIKTYGSLFMRMRDEYGAVWAAQRQAQDSKQ